jgi:hypothetical protein
VFAHGEGELDFLERREAHETCRPPVCLLSEGTCMAGIDVVSIQDFPARRGR